MSAACAGSRRLWLLASESIRGNCGNSLGVYPFFEAIVDILVGILGIGGGAALVLPLSVISVPAALEFPIALAGVAGYFWNFWHSGPSGTHSVLHLPAYAGWPSLRQRADYAVGTKLVHAQYVPIRTSFINKYRLFHWID